KLVCERTNRRRSAFASHCSHRTEVPALRSAHWTRAPLAPPAVAVVAAAVAPAHHRDRPARLDTSVAVLSVAETLPKSPRLWGRPEPGKCHRRAYPSHGRCAPSGFLPERRMEPWAGRRVRFGPTA